MALRVINHTMNILLAASSILLVLAVAQKRVGAVRDLAASVDWTV